MVHVILHPRELEQLEKPIRAHTAETEMLRAIVARIERVGADYELAISDADLVAARVFAKNWRSPHAKAFEALLSAARRHI